MVYRRNAFVLMCIMANLLCDAMSKQISSEPKSNQELLPVFLKAAQDGCGDVVVKLFKVKPGSVKAGKTESEIDKRWQKHLADAQKRAQMFGHLYVAQRIKEEEILTAQRIAQRQEWRIKARALSKAPVLVKPQFKLDLRNVIMPVSA